jgi:opacity protein-like surface antigen
MRRWVLVGSILLAAGASAAVLAPAARATTVQTTTPFTDVVTNPCNGDVVYVTGTYHAAVISDQTKGEIQTNWPDTSGYTPTGRQYQANDTTHTYVFDASANAFTFGFADEYELVSEDGASNFLVHVDVKIDLLTGEPKVSRTSMTCTPSS